MVTMDVRPVEGYHPELGLLLASLQDGTNEWRDELGDVDEGALVWCPCPGGPSVGAELMNIAEVEAWWIQEVVSDLPLSDEFKRRVLADETDQYKGVWGEAPRMPLTAYFDLLDEVRARTRERLKDERPDRAVCPDPDFPDRTVRWCLSHVLQHEAYHAGQAVLLKRLATGGTW